MKYLTTLILLVAMQADNSSQYRVKGIDVYDTSQITTAQVKRKLGAKFLAFARQFPDGNELEKIHDEIVASIAKMGSFAHIEMGVTVGSDDLKGLHISVDVVDKKDKAKRMSFLPAPTKDIADPEGLVAAWMEYEKKHYELFLKGALHMPPGSCPALHCINDFSNPELKPYLEIFQTKVARNKDDLVKVLRESRNAEQRAAAAFLLAHTTDAAVLVQTLEPSIADANSTVRNNVMRVLMEIGVRQQDVMIRIAPLLQALDYPKSTDRNKALYTLLSLADRPGNKMILQRQAGETLLKILRLTQPNNHDPAYEILKKISGKNYGDRDYANWAAWLKKTNKQE